jgi:hypothetical protein
LQVVVEEGIVESQTSCVMNLAQLGKIVAAVVHVDVDVDDVVVIVFVEVVTICCRPCCQCRQWHSPLFSELLFFRLNEFSLIQGLFDNTAPVLFYLQSSSVGRGGVSIADVSTHDTMKDAGVEDAALNHTSRVKLASPRNSEAGFVGMLM